MKAKYESELRESMKNEGCELISEYNGSNVPVYYLYNSLEYKVIPWKWKRGHRAHLGITKTYHTEIFNKKIKIKINNLFLY